MKPLLFCLPLLLVLQTAHACINHSQSESKQPPAPTAAMKLKVSREINLTNKGRELAAQTSRATGFEERSDHAVGLIYIGRPTEAVTLLEKLEQEQPGKYFIAANLGTAYELSGNNEAALHWIKEGIRRDPSSHFGTEWLHVQILEAKIAHAKDPDYFKKHSVLNLKPSATGNRNYFVVHGQPMMTEKLMQALEYQLGERLQFVKDSDMPVATLLFDYATLEATGGALESARDLVEMALQYGYPAAQGKPLLRSYDRQILWTKAREMITILGLAALVIGVLGFLFVKWVNRPLQD